MTASSIQRAAVIGAGAWGTALARHLAHKQIPVCLWAYEADVVYGSLVVSVSLTFGSHGSFET